MSLYRKYLEEKSRREHKTSGDTKNSTKSLEACAEESQRVTNKVNDTEQCNRPIYREEKDPALLELPLDRFLVACSVMAHIGKLEEDKHYAVRGGRMYIYFPGCFAIYLEHCMCIGQRPVCRDVDSLMSIAIKNYQRDGYVKEINRRILLGCGRPCTVAIDVKEASYIMDFDPFPTRKNLL